MNINRIVVIKGLAFSALLLWVLDGMSRLFYFYWTISWMDIVTHFLGGVVVALFFSLFSFFRKGTPFQVGYKLFLTVLVVGIAWEIFELLVGLTFTTKVGYNLDTTIDICMDILGTVIAYIYLIKNQEKLKT